MYTDDDIQDGMTRYSIDSVNKSDNLQMDHHQLFSINAVDSDIVDKLTRSSEYSDRDPEINRD